MYDQGPLGRHGTNVAFMLMLIMPTPSYQCTAACFVHDSITCMQGQLSQVDGFEQFASEVLHNAADVTNTASQAGKAAAAWSPSYTQLHLIQAPEDPQLLLSHAPHALGACACCRLHLLPGFDASPDPAGVGWSPGPLLCRADPWGKVKKMKVPGWGRQQEVGRVWRSRH